MIESSGQPTRPSLDDCVLSTPPTPTTTRRFLPAMRRPRSCVRTPSATAHVCCKGRSPASRPAPRAGRQTPRGSRRARRNAPRNSGPSLAVWSELAVIATARVAATPRRSPMDAVVDEPSRSTASAPQYRSPRRPRGRSRWAGDQAVAGMEIPVCGGRRPASTARRPASDSPSPPTVSTRLRRSAARRWLGGGGVTWRPCLDMDSSLVDSRWSGPGRCGPANTGSTPPGCSPSPTAARRRPLRRLLPDLDDAAISTIGGPSAGLQYDDLADVGTLAGMSAGSHDGAPRPEVGIVTSADRRLATAAERRRAPPTIVAIRRRHRREIRPARLPRRQCHAGRAGVALPRRSRSSQPGWPPVEPQGRWSPALKGIPGDVVLDDLHQLAELLEQSRADTRVSPTRGSARGTSAS